MNTACRKRSLSIARLLGCVALLGALAQSAAAQNFPAKVVEVSAGDIFEIVHEGKRELVVLYGVDAPGPHVRVGKQAKAFAEERVLDKTVQVRVVKRREGTTFVDLTLPDGSNLSHVMLRQGLARWDPLSAPDDTGLKELQRLAQQEERGLWHHVSLEEPSQALSPREPSEPTVARTRRDRAAPAGDYQIVEERVLVDEAGVKTLVLRGTGQKQAGYELAAEQQRLAEYQARMEQRRQQQQEQYQEQLEAQRRAQEQQRRAQQERVQQMQLEQMQMLNRQLQQQRGVNITVTPLRQNRPRP